MNKQLLFDFQLDAQDKHGEINIEKVVEFAIQHVLAITRMRTYRNGLESKENLAIDHIRRDITEYFQIQERDVNETMDNNELLREYFKIPRKGDVTDPHGKR